MKKKYFGEGDVVVGSYLLLWKAALSCSTLGYGVTEQSFWMRGT